MGHYIKDFPKKKTEKKNKETSIFIGVKSFEASHQEKLGYRLGSIQSHV